MGKLNLNIILVFIALLTISNCKKNGISKTGVKIYPSSAILATEVIEGKDGVVHVWGPIRDSATGYLKGVFIHNYDPQLNLIGKLEFTNGLQSMNAVYNPFTNGWLLYNYGGTPSILYNCDANLKIISQASFKFKNKTSYLLITDLKIAQNGDIFVASSYLPTGNNYSVTTTGISRLSSDLNTIWDYKVPAFTCPLGTVSGTENTLLTEADDGNIYIFGNAYLPLSSAFSRDIFIGKLSPNGTMQFLKSERFSTDNKIVYLGFNQSRFLTITNVSGNYQFNNFDTLSGQLVNQNKLNSQLQLESYLASFENRNCMPNENQSFCLPVIYKNTNQIKMMVSQSNLVVKDEYPLSFPGFYTIWGMSGCRTRKGQYITALSYISLNSTHDFAIIKTNERGKTVE